MFTNSNEDMTNLTPELQEVIKTSWIAGAIGF